MEARRRQASASTSTSLSHEETASGKNNTNVASTSNSGTKGSSGSLTPKPDEEDDGTPRRTRHRNPLPPTKGPLFPPLPPKQPRNSPKNSPQSTSRSPAGRTPSLSTPVQSGSALANALASGDGEEADVDAEAGEAEAEAEAEGDDEPEADAEAEASGSGSAEDGQKPLVASNSGTSLTPPPADGEMDVDEPPAESQEEQGDADWGAYRRNRRGFNAAIKVEPTDDGPPSRRASATVDTPADSTTSDREGERGGSTSRIRKRRGEDQLLLDDHLLPKEIRQLSSVPKRRESRTVDADEKSKAMPVEEEGDNEEAVEDEEEEAEEEDEDEEEGGQEVTRCVCHTEDDDIMMIQCDKCNVWQHGGCMGIWGDDEAPDEYFCEECRPDLHGPLRKWIRSRGRNVANFIAPSPEDLISCQAPHDKHPPSQSKRWLDQEKPTSRSHHRKEPPSPAEADGRRSTRGRVPVPEKPVSSGPQVGGSRRRAPGTGHDRRVSIDVSPSQSPPVSIGPGGVKFEPKRRSTMNSRDAAYEEQVKAALEASRRELGDDEPVSGMVAGAAADAAAVAAIKDEESEDRKRRRADDDDGEKKGKKRKDEEAVTTEEATPAPPPKPKHPNQYTYRPKQQPGVAQPAVASPARRPAAGTPQPTGPPPAHDHGTRRAGAIASNLAAAPYTPASVSNLNWYLPDHLASYADLLPATTPLPLQVPTPRTLAFLPRNHFINYRYGPFVDERDADGNLILSDERPEREAEGEPSTHREPPARVRYPVKRITVSEIKKRVRNLLEYVGRVQIEESKRVERTKTIGVREGPYIRKEAKHGQDEGEEKGNGEGVVEEKEGKEGAGDKGETEGESADKPEDKIEIENNAAEPTETTGPTEPADPTDSVPVPARASSPLITVTDGPTSSQLLDELMRDLIAFQETLHSGLAIGVNGFASPAPGSGAMMETPMVPPTPTMMTGPGVPDAEGEGVVEATGEGMAAEATGEGAEVGAGTEAKAGGAMVESGDTVVVADLEPATASEPVDTPAAPTEASAEASTITPAEPVDTPADTPMVLTSLPVSVEHIAEATTEVYREGKVDAVVIQEAEPELKVGAEAVEGKEIRDVDMAEEPAQGESETVTVTEAVESA